jgi:large subunit ribosomal protein L15
MRGSKTHGVGFMKKGRGSGHRGGVGMAGTGKRADHKKSLILNTGEKYFGKEGLKAKPKNYLTINVSELERMADGKKELNLSKYKILGGGEIGVALTISAYGASKVAIEKVEAVGGKIIIDAESEDVESEDEKADSKDEGDDKNEE